MAQIQFRIRSQQAEKAINDLDAKVLKLHQRFEGIVRVSKEAGVAIKNAFDNDRAQMFLNTVRSIRSEFQSLAAAARSASSAIGAAGRARAAGATGGGGGGRGNQTMSSGNVFLPVATTQPSGPSFGRPGQGAPGTSLAPIMPSHRFRVERPPSQSFMNDQMVQSMQALGSFARIAAPLAALGATIRFVSTAATQTRQNLQLMTASLAQTAPALAMVRRNTFGLGAANIESKVIGIASQTGMPIERAAAISASTISALGGDVQRALQFQRTLTPFVRTLPAEEAAQFMGAVGDIAGATPGATNNPLASLGILGIIARQSRAPNIRAVQQNAPKVLKAFTQAGGSFAGGGALFSALTTASADPEGRISATGAIAVIEQLRDFLNQQQQFQGMGFDQQLFALMNNPMLAEQFRTNVQAERKALPGIREFFTPGSDSALKFFEDYKALNLSLPELASVGVQALKDLSSGIEQQTRAAQDAAQVTLQGMARGVPFQHQALTEQGEQALGDMITGVYRSQGLTSFQQGFGRNYAMFMARARDDLTGRVTIGGMLNAMFGGGTITRREERDIRGDALRISRQGRGTLAGAGTIRQPDFLDAVFGTEPTGREQVNAQAARDMAGMNMQNVQELTDGLRALNAALRGEPANLEAVGLQGDLNGNAQSNPDVRSKPQDNGAAE